MYVSNRDTSITNVHMHTPYPEGTLRYENLHRINYSNLAQNHQIHGMKYQQILIFQLFRHILCTSVALFHVNSYSKYN